jgi:hypothetical protein
MPLALTPLGINLTLRARCGQVGASNELPESEELDALYDRFLLRYPVCQARASRARPCSLALTAGVRFQVSEAGLGALLQLASGDPAVRAREAPDGTLQLSAEAMAAVRARAYAEVTLPDEMIVLLTELRTYLQDTCEPPVYVSGALHLCTLTADRAVLASTCLTASTRPSARPPPRQGGCHAARVGVHLRPAHHQRV